MKYRLITSESYLTTRTIRFPVDLSEKPKQNYLRSTHAHVCRGVTYHQADSPVKCHSSVVKTLQLAVIRAMWVRLCGI